MKFKTHKIRNVEKNICTCEQMCAYNIAFRLYVHFSTEWEKFMSVNPFKSTICSEVSRLVDFGMDEFISSLNGKKSKYNIDVIKMALHNGLEEYLNHHFIASDYEQVGKSFPLTDGYDYI